MQFQVDGFSLIGRTQLSVDDQIVYTSEIDPTTGQAIEKPMIVTGQLTDELGSNLSNRAIRITYEMVDGFSGRYFMYSQEPPMLTASSKLFVRYLE